MERLLLADGQVVGLEFSICHSKFYPGVEREMFEGGKSTFAVMEKFGHISAKGVDELAVTTLEPQEAALFGMEPGVPVLIRPRHTESEVVSVKGSRHLSLQPRLFAGYLMAHSAVHGGHGHETNW